MAKKAAKNEHGEVLVAILKSVSDFTILQDQGLYRIPVATAPKKWPPKWLAFYQPKTFGDQAYRIQYWGEVADVSRAYGKDLFPEKPYGPKADKEYYQLELRELKELNTPIPSHRPRHLVFIPTTKYKFDHAEQINDLFHESPLEDRLWNKFKELEIKAERQWFMPIENRRYYLDFAIFCKERFLIIETDGDQHKKQPQLDADRKRNNDLESRGWHVLHYDSKQINEHMESYTIPQILKAINEYGSLSDEGLVPRKFFTVGGKTIQQLSLFERQAAYQLDPGFDSGASENLEIDD